MTPEQPSGLAARPVPGVAPSLMDRLAGLQWWLLVAIFLALLIVFSIVTDARMTVIFRAISRGIQLTLTVTFVAYSIALVIGLLVGLGRVSRNRLAWNLATFYIEIVRGIPILVLLLYIAFVAVPYGVDLLNAIGEWLLAQNLGVGQMLASVSSRDISNTWRVIIGLAIAYGAFSAEIFRAGIESVEAGQMEAARALGMTYPQAMRYIILPQGIRRVLPALGNDFVAMLKDSSLVSVLGVQDITQLTKLYAASTFLFFQAYSILAFIYLLMTIMLTRFVRWLERRFSEERR